jgi:hypothetical protein
MIGARIARHTTLWQAQISLHMAILGGYRAPLGVSACRTREMAEGGGDRTFHSGDGGGGAVATTMRVFGRGIVPTTTLRLEAVE